MVDATTAADLRRVLRPGGVCMHNYGHWNADNADSASIPSPGESNPAGGCEILPLTREFEEVHRLRLPTIYGGNTLLFSRRQRRGRLRQTAPQSLDEIAEQAKRVAPTAPFDLAKEVRRCVQHRLSFVQNCAARMSKLFCVARSHW